MSTSTTIDYKTLYEASEQKNVQLEVKVMELTQQLQQEKINREVQVTELSRQLQQLRKMIFGSRSERFIPSQPGASQPLLFDIPEDGPSCSVIDTKQVSYTKTKVVKSPSTHHGRMKLPGHLRRETIMVEPEGDMSGCKKIGEEVTEELEYQPGELFVNRFVRPKYVCPVADEEAESDTKIVIAELPERPLEKCIAGPGLLAQLIIDKYVDHLPVHRQMQRFARTGVNIPLTTLITWITALCVLIEPLGDALIELVLRSNYLHADETGIKVLDKDKNGAVHNGYFWVYQDSRKNFVFFDYQPTRSKEGPDMVLKDFRGNLQTDGYETYSHFDKLEGVTQSNCMSHARRKFFDAKDNDVGRAEYVLQQMGLLYGIEKKARDWSADQRLALRQREAIPILDKLGIWMKAEYKKVPPQSAIAKALAYSINRWEKLCLYSTDGDLCIDNNPVERSIRAIALGRKNYMFCGSHQAARRAAMLYSLLGTCKLHNVNPYEWLKDVIIRIPSHPINRIEELLPHIWCQQRSAVSEGLTTCTLS
jgi:transposase